MNTTSPAHPVFRDFKSALAFVNRVGELSEGPGHHPYILPGLGQSLKLRPGHKKKKTKKTKKTAVDGLTESDFILAAKIDRLPRFLTRETALLVCVCRPLIASPHNPPNWHQHARAAGDIPGGHHPRPPIHLTLGTCSDG